VISDAQGNATSIQLTKFNNSLRWKHHSIADISALPIMQNPEIQHHLTNRFLPLNHFQTQRNPVSRDIELTTVGFPKGLGVNGMFSPLSYRSYASSALISLNRADTNTPCEFFLLENPSIGGYSGGPVFDLGVMVVGSMTTTKDQTYWRGQKEG
jgi:hypothetical protein